MSDCPNINEPRGCWRVRCQLGKKCVEPERITNEQREAIVRKAVAERDALLADLTPEMLAAGAMEIAMNNQRVMSAERKAEHVYRAMVAARLSPSISEPSCVNKEKA